MKPSVRGLAAIALTLLVASCASTKKFEDPKSPDYLGLDHYPTAEPNRNLANAGAAVIDSAAALRAIGVALGTGESAVDGMRALNILHSANVFSGVVGFAGKSKITVDMWKNAVTSGTYKVVMDAIMKSHQSGQLKKLNGIKINDSAWSDLSKLAQNVKAGSTTVRFLDTSVASLSEAQKRYFLDRVKDLQGEHRKFAQSEAGKRMLTSIGVSADEFVRFANGIVRAEMMMASKMIAEEGGLSDFDRLMLAADPDHYGNCLNAIGTVPSAATMMGYFVKRLSEIYGDLKSRKIATASPDATACLFTAAMKAAYKDAYAQTLDLDSAVSRNQELGQSCGMVGKSGIFQSALNNIKKLGRSAKNTMNDLLGRMNYKDACWTK